jgi:CDP-diacylglycerol--serine O-phosphatidyltransferase
MIGYYNYTVILTYIGTICGFMGIIFATSGDLKSSLIFLMVSGLCDMFDGKIASTKKNRTKDEKRFGIQIDSLSDLICFGMLPAVIGFRFSGAKAWHIPFAALYLLCALIRLAWFNVDEEKRQDTELKSRENFRGLPVTTAALLFPIVIGVLSILKLPVNLVCPWLLLLVAISFIAPFSMKKAGIIGKIIMLLCGVAGLVILLIGVK